MTVAGLPSPIVALTSEDQRATKAWYNYLKSADSTWRPKLTVITTGTTTNTLISHDGVTLIQTTPPSTHTLANPEPGVRKVIVVQSASTACRIESSSTTNTIKPGTGWALAFTTSATDKVIELVGVSTSDWYIVSNPGSATVTT